MNNRPAIIQQFSVKRRVRQSNGTVKGRNKSREFKKRSVPRPEE